MSPSQRRRIDHALDTAKSSQPLGQSVSHQAFVEKPRGSGRFEAATSANVKVDLIENVEAKLFELKAAYADLMTWLKAEYH
jgi:hypothetical protein